MYVRTYATFHIYFFLIGTNIMNTPYFKRNNGHTFEIQTLYEKAGKTRQVLKMQQKSMAFP